MIEFNSVLMLITCAAVIAGAYWWLTTVRKKHPKLGDGEIISYEIIKGHEFWFILAIFMLSLAECMML